MDLQNNLFDKFDGTGPSGMNVNYQLGNNYIIQEQWPFGVVNFIYTRISNRIQQMSCT
jgi:hypothetical protein